MLMRTFTRNDITTNFELDQGMTTLDESCFTFLKTKRSHGNKGLEDMSHHIIILLRRMRNSFPEYGTGFLYLVLREFDFDYILALQALKTNLKEKSNLVVFPKSMTLNDVKILLINYAKHLDNETQSHIEKNNPRQVEVDLANSLSQPSVNQSCEVELPSKSTSSMDPSYNTPQPSKEISAEPLAQANSQSNNLKYLDELRSDPILTKKNSESSLSNINVEEFLVQSPALFESTLSKSSDISSDKNVSSQSYLSEQESPKIKQSLEEFNTNTFTKRNASRPCSPHIFPPDDTSDSKDLMSSFSSCCSPGSLNDSRQSLHDSVDNGAQGDSSSFVSPLRTSSEEQSNTLVLNEKNPDELPCDKVQPLSMPSYKPRSIYEGRRRVILLDDNDEDIYHIKAQLNEYHKNIATPSLTQITLSRHIIKEKVSKVISDASKDQEKISKRETHKAKSVASLHQPAHQLVLNSADMPPTPSLVHPYANALETYLIRESEYLKHQSHEVIVNEESSTPPFPEMAGFRWWASKRCYFRYCLESPYLRPRHKFFLCPKIYNALYFYQKTSVAWMFELFKTRRGGILADEMGLGKTVQAVVFLRGLFCSGLATHAIVLMPLTLLSQWKAHLMKWCPTTFVFVYHGSRNERRLALEACFGVARGSNSVLLTTYETFRSAIQDLCRVNLEGILSEFRCESAMFSEIRRLRESGCSLKNSQEEAWYYTLKEELELYEKTQSRPWDVVVMDEAHKIKNTANKSAQAVRLLEAHCRILLTGTPVTNSLDELWSLMDCAVPGLLGNHRNFKKEFADVIKSAATRTASEELVAHKNRLSYELQQLVAPYFLRRTVQETLNKNNDISTENVDSTVNATRSQDTRFSVSLKKKQISQTVLGLPSKTDIAVWIRLTAPQHIIYESFLLSRSIRDILDRPNKTQSKGVNSMQAINVLLKLCRHPALLLPRKYPAWWRLDLGSKVNPLNSNISHLETTYETQPWYQHVFRLNLDTPEDLRLCSGKLMFMYEALPNFRKKSHRCLIFSQSTQMLDIIQVAVLDPLGLKYLRIDGSVPHDLRHKHVTQFQNDNSIFVFLMTTKVGGQGLNLTCADRLIIADPDWTPANDNQAVARIYRLGQTKDVKIYRLLTAGAIEDHAFRLQTFKQGLSKVALECAYQKTYFTNEDMKKIFTLRTDGISETMEILDSLNPEHQKERDNFESIVKEDITYQSYEKLAEDLLVGFSNYDALYRELSKHQLYEDTQKIHPEQALQNALARLNSS